MSSVPSLVSLRNPSLLVSVRDAEEAEAAWAGGADVIDVKNPSRGPLGEPGLDTVDEILARLPSHCVVTSALGELTDLHEASLLEFARRPLALLKVGTQGCRRATDAKQNFTRWSKMATGSQADAKTRLIPAAYADHLECGAPSPEEILEWVAEAGCPFLLIDTARKDGRSVLDHLSASRYRHLRETCHSLGLRLALAGSLSASLIEDFSLPMPDIFAVRGAACEQNQRGRAIESDRVRSLAQILKQFTLSRRRAGTVL